jgi:hypothetical protein
MRFGEPHAFPEKRITFQTEHVGKTKLKRATVSKNITLKMST